PEVGTRAAKKRAAELRTQWLKDPQSRVLDCTGTFAMRVCRHCRNHGKRLRRIHYTVYLPRRFFVDTAAVRSLLMLVPGGNGGRTRPFLTQIPGKTVFHRGSGGLRTKQRIDQLLAREPGLAAPMVIGLETPGHPYVNGAVEHLSVDLPAHVASLFLAGRDPQTLWLAAEGISSGSRAILDTLFAKPDSLHVAGLTCMACGSIAGARGLGASRKKNPQAISPRQVETWARESLRPRAARRELFVRFAIGTRDGQRPCSEALHELFVEHQIVNGNAVYRRLTCYDSIPGPERARCDYEEQDFASYAGEMHHYGLLEKSYAPSLEWQLRRLTELEKR
ncbi:MAG: hypothetical protein AAGA56_25805, partial [Myxococcota bacterium]